METYFTTADIRVIGNTLISKGSKNNNETGIKIYLVSDTTTNYEAASQQVEWLLHLIKD